MRRAISPMIATYLLVLVAVMAGAAVFALVFGIWGPRSNRDLEDIPERQPL